jgi:hypothetical protein
MNLNTKRVICDRCGRKLPKGDPGDRGFEYDYEYLCFECAVELERMKSSDNANQESDGMKTLSERIRNMPDGATLSQTQALADEVAQLEAEVERLQEDNNYLARETASTAKRNAQVDGVIGYACVLESMLRKRNIKLPPQPSLIVDIHRSREKAYNSENALKSGE